MNDSRKPGEGRKPWVPPVLVRLTVDLTAIRQKKAGSSDFSGNGAFS